MGFTNAVLNALTLEYEGRARRAEYWWWVLFVLVVGVAVNVLGGLYAGFHPPTNAVEEARMGIVSLLSNLVQLALLFPGICVSIRRLHDYDGKAFWAIVLLVPEFLVSVALSFLAEQGGLLLLILVWTVVAISTIGQIIIGLVPGTEGYNNFGPPPGGV